MVMDHLAQTVRNQTESHYYQFAQALDRLMLHPKLIRTPSSSVRVRFAFQTEHGQPALCVVAADDLAVELHTARSALGTLAAGIPAGEQLVAREQFGGNLLVYASISLQKVSAGSSPRSMRARFFSHSPVMATWRSHRLHDRVKGKPFFCRHKRFLAAFSSRA